MSLGKPQVKGKKSPSKLVMAFAVMAATAVVGAAGVANAAPDKAANTPMPPTKEACKKDGWKQFGFKNQGLCVKWFNQHGNGYGGNGGNATVNVGNETNVNLETNGDRNAFTIIVNNISNFFF